MGDFFNAHFINVKYDMEKGEGKVLYEKYKENIIGFPTLLLINSDGEVVHQMAGYHEPDDLIARAKDGMEGRSLFAAEKKYNDGARDIETMTIYVDALKGAFLTQKINAIMEDYLRELPVEKLMEEKELNLVWSYIKDPYSSHYKYAVGNIDRLGYRLKENRYELESKLGSAMKYAVDDIVKVTNSSQNADTLRMMRERADILRPMLFGGAVKRFNTMLAKLVMNDFRLEGKVMDVYQLLSFNQTLNLFPYEEQLLINSYRYVIQRVKDKEIWRSCLEQLLALQSKAAGRNLAMEYNYYGVIAEIHTKLGEKSKATEAQAEYDKRIAAKKEHMEAFLKKFQEEQAEE